MSEKTRCTYNTSLLPSFKDDAPQPGAIRRGLNSGYQALGAAVLWGARRVVLLGYDFQRTGGRAHWHPDHPANMGNLGTLPDWIAEMGVLARDLDGQGVEVLNATRETALRCFPRIDLSEALT